MARRRTQIACAAGLAAALSSCGGGPAAPTSGASVQLTGAIAQPIVTSARPVALTFQLQNAGRDAVTLTFPSSCHINPYIVENGSGRIVYPEGGRWACAAVITSVQLASGGVAAESILLRSAGTAASSPADVTLVPGQYSAYATVAANEVQLRAEPVTFIVQ